MAGSPLSIPSLNRDPARRDSGFGARRWRHGTRARTAVVAHDGERFVGRLVAADAAAARETGIAYYADRGAVRHQASFESRRRSDLIRKSSADAVRDPRDAGDRRNMAASPRPPGTSIRGIDVKTHLPARSSSDPAPSSGRPRQAHRGILSRPGTNALRAFGGPARASAPCHPAPPPSKTGRIHRPLRRQIHTARSTQAAPLWRDACAGPPQ